MNEFQKTLQEARERIVGYLMNEAEEKNRVNMNHPLFRAMAAWEGQCPGSELPMPELIFWQSLLDNGQKDTACRLLAVMVGPYPEAPDSLVPIQQTDAGSPDPASGPPIALQADLPQVVEVVDPERGQRIQEEYPAWQAIAQDIKRLADALAPVPDEIVGTRYIADKLGLTTTWVADMVRSGKIPAACLVKGSGNAKLWKFYREKIDRWIESH